MIFPTIVSFRHRGLSATASDGSLPNAIPERGTATACPSTVAEAPRLALSKGARATGTAVKWIGYKDPWSGIANVYVDGTLKTQVDSYSASGQAQQVLYTITGLNPGSHTLVIEVTGRKNTSAQYAWIWVDAFDFAP